MAISEVEITTSNKNSKTMLEVTGVIINVAEKRSGVSKKGNNWAAQEYTIMTNGQYPKRICFNVWGEDKINEYAITLGRSYKVGLDIDATEYGGRFYNQIKAYKVEAVGAAEQAPALANTPPQPQQQASQQPTPPPPPTQQPPQDLFAENEGNDLPF